MFSVEKEITNLECDILAVEGLLYGLKYRLNLLNKVNSDFNYRGDLSNEISRVEIEIEKNDKKLKRLKKLNDIKNQLNYPKN